MPNKSNTKAVKKKRVPVPQKPPKIEAGKKAYIRSKEKKQVKKILTKYNGQ